MWSFCRALCGLAPGLLILGLAAGCDATGPPPQIDTGKPDPTSFVNSLGMKFVRIPAGTFQMGSTDGQADERPVHEVTISEPFYLSEFEVTQAWWNALMDENPSHFKEPWRPVENVSWADVQQFIQKLNEREDANLYRLPTEAEWEYAVRAGSRTTFHFGDDRKQLREYAWYSFNSESSTWPVGQKRSNPHGLHDMYGNVWEWVQDTYNPNYYTESPEVDPRASDALARARVIRGGGWRGGNLDLRSANRGWTRPDVRNRNIGFRLVREIPDE